MRVGSHVSLLLAALLFPPWASAEAPTKEGENHVRSAASTQVEGLSEGEGDAGGEEEAAQAYPAGETIEAPGGWFRIEEEGAEGGGTFSVLSSPFSAEDEAEGEGQGRNSEDSKGAASLPRAERQRAAHQQPMPCHQEKEAYLRELFRIAGIATIDLPYPLELIQALEETPGVHSLAPSLALRQLGLQLPSSDVGVDPLRSLAWDEGLRWAAEDLIRCKRSR